MTQSWKSDDKLGAMNIPKELELNSLAVVVIKWVVKSNLQKEGLIMIKTAAGA